MKKKISKILGVILPVAMILALTVSLVPARTPTVEASALRFSTVAIPKIGADGKYVLNANRNIGTITAGSAIMFASSNITASANITDLLKSTDDGKTWTLSTAFRTAATANADTSSIVDIGISPTYTSDTTLLVATEKFVYQSVDGADTFSVMSFPAALAATETITDMDVALDSRGRVSVIVGTKETAASAGKVLVYAPATTGMGWTVQSTGTTWVTNRDVLAVAFSPYFSSDEGIFAVTVNATSHTEIKNAFGNTKLGGGWGTSFGSGIFRNRNADNVTATRASIAFPDDFNIDSLTSNVAFVGLYAGTPDGQNILEGEEGDVYKVIFQPTLSSTVDLNVRGLISTIQTSTNIWSIDVSGDAAAANIVVGTDFWSTGVTSYYWLLYYSTDSGVTWSTPRESQPTGGTPDDTNTQGSGARTTVLLSSDFATSKVAYAATSGPKTAGLSRTNDSGKSWRQISLVDWATANYTVSELDLVSTSKWYMRFTDTGNTTYRGTANAALSSYWLTSNGGANYERLYSYANPGMPVALDGLDITGANKDVFFLNNKSKFWRSTDSGATFPRIITAKAAFIGSSIIDENTIYTIHSTGVIWYTTNLGRLWVDPEESIIGATGSSAGLTRSGNYHFVTIKNGTVYVSTDGGKKYLKTLGLTNLSEGSLTLDTNFATNNIIYHTQTGSTATTNGIYRTVFNPAAPDTTEWERIDNIAPTTAVSASIDLASANTYTGGVWYSVAENVTDGTNSGGLWRSTNPSADIRGVYPPHFLFVDGGLTAGNTMARLGVLTTPEPTFYLRNTAYAGTSANYYNQVVVFSDTLNKSADLAAPADKAFDAGVSLNTEDLTMDVVLSWKAKAGATSYQWQIARDTNFESVVAQGFTSGQEVTVPRHITGMTYYWRVRVAQDADTVPTTYIATGAPLISPWSTARSYMTGSAIAVAFKAISPVVGATNVSIQPAFVWTPFAGALNYEVMVSEDPTFAIIEWSYTVTDTFLNAPETLAYDTTYYWRVRGVTGEVPKKGPAPGSPWATGTFTTEAEPVEPTPAVITVTEPAKPAEVKVIEVPVPGPAQPIPSYLLWAIIGIGAVLVIALIVLIVRTRRVT